MITNFKIYEDTEICKYWVIKIDDDLVDCRLKKIGIPLSEIKVWIDKNKSKKTSIIEDLLHKRYSKIFIGYDKQDDWTYSDEYETKGIDDNAYEDDQCEFLGDVSLTQEEIVKYKEEIEIENATKKYNL